MSAITTHVLDTARGRPAAGLGVRLERRDGERWSTLAERVTDADGRVRDLLAAGVTPAPGTYRLVFATGAYLGADGAAAFYPEVSVVFELRDPAQHHHVPLLLSPFGYTTYRGS
jgi:5-hydroxyisourate hydrolase